MTDAIDAGARAILERTKVTSREDAEGLATLVVEAAIASGALVPASAGLSAQLAYLRDRIDDLEGGLQLLLAAAKAGDPQKEIIWRVEEELRQIERHRQLDTAPASGDYVVGWRDINSAPKDGTPILGWNSEFGARETHAETYQPGSLGHAQGIREPWWAWTEPQNDWASVWRPSHWKPLDKPT